MKTKFFLISIVIAFALAASAACTIEDADAITKYDDYAYYTDIPGVTAEEIAAIESLKQEYSSFSVGMNHSTEAFYRADGSIGGYSSEFCERMSDLFGIPFTPVIREWDALLAGLTSYEIDFTGELTSTPERQEIYFMTEAIAERSIKYFRLADSEQLSAIADQRTLNYGFLDGATSSDYLAEAETAAFNSIFVQDNDEAVALLRNGRIDAFFEDGCAEAAFDIYPDIIAAEYFPLIYTPVSLSTANPDFTPIISVVDKYLQQGGGYHLTALYNKSEQEYYKHKLYNQLSDEEKAYLAENSSDKPILIATEFDNYPVCFYNKTEEEWQGIAIDVLAEISELTGLTFLPSNQPDATWPELLAALEQGEVALISELIPSQERANMFLWPDDPYCVDNLALISLTEQENIKVNQILYSSVGVAEDTAYQEIFERWFPNHQNTKIYESTDDCFVALETGEVDFIMGSRNMMLSMTNYSEKPGFKVNILFSSTYESSFGLNENETLLNSIISKAQKQIDMQSITEHWTHRVFDYRAKLARTQIPYLVGLAILLAVVLMLVIVLFLRHRKTGRELEQLVQQRTAELEVQTKAAEQASKAKSDFLSRMSHEIRTPLNAVIGMAQVSKQIPNLPEKAVNTNNSIITASNHLLDVLNDILDMAKIESGKFVLADEPFALKQAMQEVEDIISERCYEKHIRFATNLQELPDIGIIGDKLRLKQILINLLGNAVKFTAENGQIDFLITKQTETADNISLHFLVRDNGIGMSKEQIERLFAAFEQADSSISVKYGGTGLGLAISQNMVHKMGGEIVVSSAPEKGSSFSFNLDFAKTALPEITEAKTSMPDLHDCRILIVEDVDINRLVLVELLANSGVHIEEATDGKQAVELMQSSPAGYYDLIFMDVQMPVMDGYTATETIRAMSHADAKSIPIIAMTANAYKEDVDKALACGMNDHIAKPVDLDIIYRILHKYLNR